MWVIFVSWPHDMMKKAVLYKLVQPTRTVDMQSINIWPLLPNIHRVITISFGYVFISLFFKLLTALLLSACCCDYVPGIICGTRRNSDELDLSWRRSDGNKLDIHSRGERQTFKKPPELCAVFLCSFMKSLLDGTENLTVHSSWNYTLD